MKQQLLLNVLFKKLFFILSVSLTATAFQGCETTQPALDESAERDVLPPFWAPTYDNVSQVHYYYLPDVETYYDVWGSEFVFLDAGQWIFSPFLPPMYMLYDLRSAPVVILDFRVHEPWRYHELYVSHYPRYYFQTISSGTNMVRQRGLDENVNKPVFYGTRESMSGSAEPKKSLPLLSTSPSMVSANKKVPANYKGKVTGQPVKVDKKMMKPKDSAKKEDKKKEAKPKKEKSTAKPQVSNYKELPIEKK